MPSAPSPSLQKRETLNLRVKPEEKDLIDRAARSRGKTRAIFVLEAARAAAEEALLDQTFLTTNKEAHAAFIARLDMPPNPNANLVKTMQVPPPWDKA